MIECPHRMAPLSEGRIEKDGNLLCSYRAWRFNESGKCVKIPHAEDEKAHSVACSSSRSAVQTYPCKNRAGILWMWSDRSISAFGDSEKATFPIDEDIADRLEYLSSCGVSTAYVRHLPYSFDILVENLCDPSHFPVAHHSLLPNTNRYKAKPLNAKLVKGISQIPATAAIRFDAVSLSEKWGQAEFRKPGTLYFLLGKKHADAREPVVFATASPVSSGKTVSIITFAPRSKIHQTGKPNAFIKALMNLLSLVIHIKVLNPIGDGDSVFLHGQDKNIKARGTNFKADKEYYVPISADLLVMAFRK
eukprot:g8975.t1